MSDEIDRQKVEAWFDPPVKIPRPILDSMAADLDQAQAMADALAVENAELRAALDALNVVIPDLHEVKGVIREQGREPDDGFPIMLCLDLGDIRRAVDLLAADPAQRGSELLTAADALAAPVPSLPGQRLAACRICRVTWLIGQPERHQDIEYGVPCPVVAYRRLRGGRVLGGGA
jgi:hypothetical protein